MKAAKAENVGVVVGASEAGGIGVDSEGGSYAGKFVSGDADADSGFTDDDALVGAALRDIGGDGGSVVWIVCAFGAEAAVVFDGDAAFFEKLDKCVF